MISTNCFYFYIVYWDLFVLGTCKWIWTDDSSECALPKVKNEFENLYKLLKFWIYWSSAASLKCWSRFYVVFYQSSILLFVIIYAYKFKLFHGQILKTLNAKFLISHLIIFKKLLLWKKANFFSWLIQVW